MSIAHAVQCGDCGKALNENPSASMEERGPCPDCASMKRAHFVEAGLGMKVYDSVGYKHKRPGVSRGPVAWGYSGWQLRKSVGDYVKKYSLFDRQTNRRYEHVETEDGQVLHHEDHPLTEHKGHGSDKFSSTD
jgi:hypothetical protein